MSILDPTRVLQVDPVAERARTKYAEKVAKLDAKYGKIAADLKVALTLRIQKRKYDKLEGKSIEASVSFYSAIFCTKTLKEYINDKRILTGWKVDYIRPTAGNFVSSAIAIPLLPTMIFTPLAMCLFQNGTYKIKLTAIEK